MVLCDPGSMGGTPQCGDELHTRAGGRLGAMQEWFVTRPGERPTLSTHAGGFLDERRLVNAHFPRVRMEDWEPYRDRLLAGGGEWCILRYSQALTANELIVYAAFLRAHVGNLYSVPEIFGHALDGLLSRRLGRDVRLFRRLVDRVPQWVICSGLQAKAGIRIGRLPAVLATASPDDLWDWRMQQLARGEVYIHAHTPGWWRSAAEPRFRWCAA